MRYIQAPGGVFSRHLSNVEATAFDANTFALPRHLSPAEATAFGVFPLKLVTPPPHSDITHARTDGPALLVAGVWTQAWLMTAHLPDEVTARTLAAKLASNAAINARLALNDTTIIRALTEGDTGRITAFRATQAALRATLKP